MHLDWLQILGGFAMGICFCNLVWLAPRRDR